MSDNPKTWMYHLYVIWKKSNSYMHKLKKWLSMGDVRNTEKLVKDDKISPIKWIKSKDLTYSMVKFPESKTSMFSLNTNRQKNM